jgi:hypothetical protein
MDSFWDDATVRIVENMVGLMLTVHLIIWNWKDACQILVIYFSSLSCPFSPRSQLRDFSDMPPGPNDFAFISNQAYMVSGGFGSGSIHIHTLSMPDAHAHSTTLSLPPNKVTIGVSFHSGPFVTRPAAETPFTTASASLYVMLISYMGQGESTVNLHLVVHNQTLLSYLSLSERASDNVKVAWDDWGPANTRFLDADWKVFGTQ